MNISQFAGALRQTAATVVDNLKREPAATPAVVAPADPKDWTVLVYMEGADRLATSSQLGLDKLAGVAAHPGVNVVAQVTQKPTWQERLLPNMRDLPTRRYQIEPGKKTIVGEMKGQVPLNSTSLADFVSWGMKAYPAKHTMLIIKKHGAGFASEGKDLPLSATDMGQGLTRAESITGKKLDVISFDSCSMQQMEVAYELRNHASVMTGSEDDVLASAFPYGPVVTNLDQQPDAPLADVGKQLVKTYAANAGHGMQSAIDLTKMDAVAASLKQFGGAVQQSQVSPSQLYTTMLSTQPMERGETLNAAFNFRDIGTFLKAVALDEHYPQSVRDAATAAAASYKESIISDAASPDEHRLREDTGATAFFPWKQPDAATKAQYQGLEWTKDSGWGNFLDYVLTPDPNAAPAAKPKLEGESLPQGLARWGLFQYKKYISPELETTCAYDLSCSQYAREAIEQHGFWEGSKLGALRFFSCDGSIRGHDPVPDAPEEPVVAPVAPAQISAPAGTTDLSGLQKNLIRVAQVAGSVAGGLGLGALSAAVGTVVGANLAWKTVNGKLDQQRADILQTDGKALAHGFDRIATPLVAPVTRVQSEIGHGLLGKLAGVATGAALGAAGGAWQGEGWGKSFGGMWAENRTKDAFGMLPLDPKTEGILRQDYAAPSVS